MTVPVTGALPSFAQQWQTIDGDAVKNKVKRLQMRIAKAVKCGVRPATSPYTNHNLVTAGLLKKSLIECLSRMLGNSLVRF